ncbi:MAG: 50S ribosomal protein L16 [Cytophagales bacterium]|jgi:large subunit ribosomal protein L16|nr:50S ribosomal protein L16 [Cytophagales bacterium]
MLQPKKTKFRKIQKGKIKGSADRGCSVAFGSYGVKSLQPGFVTNRQIEAARIVISRSLSKNCKMWIRVFPDKSITKKPNEVRMGGGKGEHEYWAAPVKPGRVLFEVEGLDLETAKRVMGVVGDKLSMKTAFTCRPDLVKF